jgi:hypothetical protein
VPRYRFDLEFEGEAHRGDAIDLERERDARVQAIEVAVQMLKDRVAEMPDGGRVAVTVRDEKPHPLVVVRASLFIEDRPSR